MMKRMHFFGRSFPTPPVAGIHRLAILISVFGLILSNATFASSWETSSLRTSGGGLIRVGMTRQEVLKELGQSQRAYTSAHHTAPGGKSGKKTSSLAYRGDDGLYTITFSGEQVVKIMVTPKRD